MKRSAALPEPPTLRNSQSRPALEAFPLSQLYVLVPFPPQRLTVAPSSLRYAGSANATP